MKTALAFVAMTALATSGATAAMLKAGEMFPEWELADQTGAMVSSHELTGKTYLLWFFPKAMTSGCTKEGCSLRDSYIAFKDHGVEIVGVSFDDPKTNMEFTMKYNFPFRLLSDTDKKLAVEAGAADSTKASWARRISYLIGPDGKILKAYDNVDPRTHAAQVLADLKTLAPEAH
jgi:peroxiredoxin Q/BCP